MRPIVQLSPRHTSSYFQPVDEVETGNRKRVASHTTEAGRITRRRSRVSTGVRGGFSVVFLPIIPCFEPRHKVSTRVRVLAIAAFLPSVHMLFRGHLHPTPKTSALDRSKEPSPTGCFFYCCTHDMILLLLAHSDRSSTACWRRYAGDMWNARPTWSNRRHGSGTG